GPAQAQNAQAQQQGETADHDTGDQRRRPQRPGMAGNQIHADVATKAKKRDIAEIDVTGITDHQIQTGRQDDVDGGQPQVRAQGDVACNRRDQDKNQRHGHADPEKRPPQHGHDALLRSQLAIGRGSLLRRHQRPLPMRNRPLGNATKMMTNSVNSMTGVQLTLRNGATPPSIRPSRMPPSSAPAGLPRPPRTTATKLLSSYTMPDRIVNGNRVAMSRPETPAMAMPKPKLNAMTRLVGMPISSAAARLLDTARTALPMRVYCRNRYNNTAITSANTAARICVPGVVYWCSDRSGRLTMTVYGLVFHYNLPNS